MVSLFKNEAVGCDVFLCLEVYLVRCITEHSVACAHMLHSMSFFGGFPMFWKFRWANLPSRRNSKLYVKPTRAHAF